MAQAKTANTTIMDGLTEDKKRTETALARHRKKLQELESLDMMIWGREAARSRKAVNRAEQRLAELARLFSNLK